MQRDELAGNDYEWVKLAAMNRPPNWIKVLSKSFSNQGFESCW
jgi:hypothetical protein